MLKHLIFKINFFSKNIINAKMFLLFVGVKKNKFVLDISLDYKVIKRELKSKLIDVVQQWRYTHVPTVKAKKKKTKKSFHTHRYCIEYDEFSSFCKEISSGLTTSALIGSSAFSSSISTRHAISIAGFTRLDGQESFTTSKYTTRHPPSARFIGNYFPLFYFLSILTLSSFFLNITSSHLSCKLNFNFSQW